MCRLCETRLLSDRIARQIKNIDAGGAISLDALREILVAARADLDHFLLTHSAIHSILLGETIVEDAGVDPEAIAKRAGGHLN